MNRRRRIVSHLIILALLFGLTLFYSMRFGSALGDRQTVWPPTLTVISAIRERTTVEITIHNNATYPTIGKAIYTLTRPSDHSAVYKSAPTSFGPLAPLSTTTIGIQLPNAIPDGLDLTAQVSEDIVGAAARLEASTAEASGSFQASEQAPSEISAVSVQLLSDARHENILKITFTLTNIGNEVVNYRFLARISTMTIPSSSSETVTLGKFQYRTLEAGAKIPIQYEQTVVLPTGDYEVTLWLQAADSSGNYEQRSQWIMPTLLRLGH